MKTSQIYTATTDTLRNRMADLEDRATAINFTDGLMTEADHAELVAIDRELGVIERELDARWYANHPDARVRQGMGAC